MSHIFLSYAHKDSDYVEKLHQELERRKLKVWRDTHLLPGDVWSNGITNAIRECQLVTVIMTPSSSISPWVNRELNIAERFKKPIIPLLLAGESFDLLTDIQFEDVTTGQLPSERFYKKLEQLLKPSTVTLTPAEEIQKLRLEIERLEKLVDEAQKPALEWEKLETSKVHKEIRSRLIEIAKQRDLISYAVLGREVGMRNAEEWWRTLPGILGRISIEENEQGRPLLSALVVNKDSYAPGSGFYKLARALNPKYQTADNDKIFSDELNAIYSYWETHGE